MRSDSSVTLGSGMNPPRTPSRNTWSSRASGSRFFTGKSIIVPSTYCASSAS